MIVDVNVNLSRWPFRRLPCDEPRALVAKLRKHNVTQAWAGTFDGVFHNDVTSANARLAAECREFGPGLLLPFGSVNPKLPDWQEDLRRCHEEHRMAGIRLHPNYHGYKLDDPDFRDLIKLAAQRKMVVQLAVVMEDERTQHARMRVPPVDLEPLARIVSAEPELRLVLLNCYYQLPIAKLKPLSGAGRVYFDISMVERVAGVPLFAEQVTLERVLFGSHFPLFNFESAALKLQEAGLPKAQMSAILAGNARTLVAR